MKKYSSIIYFFITLVVISGVVYLATNIPDQDDWMREISQSVVGITSKDWINDQQVIEKEGSGFLASKDGLVVTSAHVLGNQLASYEVIFEDGRQLPADKIFEDKEKDIALLQIVHKDLTFPFLMISEPEDLDIGDQVFSAYFDHSKKKTIVNSGWVKESSFESDDQLIQSTASISQGGSGGPLLNSQGKVMGINVGIQKEDLGITLSRKILKDLLEKIDQ